MNPLMRLVSKMRIAPVPRTSSRLRLSVAGLAAALALVSGIGCEKSATGPREVGPDGRAVGRLVIVVPVGELTATSLVVEVSAPDINPTMVFNMPVVGGVASGSIAVPAGSGRLFTVRAFDGATETHRGTKVLSVVAGANPTASITLAPLAGTVPIVATLGSLVITVTPLTASPRVGDTLRFAATIRDAVGAILPGPARWASTNTAKLVIDTAGLATVVDTGTITVVATYSTSAGIATVTALPATGGPTPGYLRTWVGGTGTGSVRTDWAVANNWTPAFVPTAADSVVIGAATYQPNIATDTFAVRDLVLRTGATLSATCCGGIRLRVARVLSGEGGTFGTYASILLRNGAQVRGVLPTSITVPASVGAALVDSARIGTLTIDGAGADFALAGKRLVVTGTGSGVVVNNGGLLHMTAAAETLDTQGYLQITTSAATHFGALTAGRFILRNAQNYLDGFQGSGTNTVEFANTLATNINGMDYTAAGRGANAFQNVVVSGAGGIASLYYNVRVLGSFDVRAGAGPVGDTYYYTLRIDGPLTTAAGTTVTSPYLYIDLRHSTGTANVNGTWSPNYTDFNTPNQSIRAGLAYQNVRFYQSQVISDSVRIAGSLQVDGSSTVLDITSPKRVIVGSMNLTSSATFVLDAASDTLEVHGDVLTSGGGNSLGKLTDGVLILWGSLAGDRYSATGNNLVKFDNPGTGLQRLTGFNPSATPVTGLQNFEVSGSGNVDVCSNVKVGGTLRVSSAVSVTTCYVYGFYASGPITTVAGSTMAPNFVQMGHVSGTNRVAGNWSPSYTDIVTPGDTLKPGLAYQTVRFYASDSLQAGANYTFTGDLYVDGTGVVMGLRGAKLDVQGQLYVQNSSRLLMVNGDTMSVAGNITWNSSVVSAQTGGQISWGGQYFNMAGYNAGGTAGSTHKLKVTNATLQPRLNTTDPTARPLARLEVSSPYGLMLDGSIAVKDSFVVSGTGPNANIQANYYYSLETRGPVVSAATSTIMPVYFALNGTTSLADVAGNFGPGALYVYQASPGLLRNGPNFHYADVHFYTSYTLNDTLTTTPNAAVYPYTWSGSMSVNNAGTALDLGGKRLRLSGGFDANSNAILKMVTGPGDTLIVGDGSTGAPGNLYLDGGSGFNSLLNEGTIILRGNTTLGNIAAGANHTLVMTDSGLPAATRTYTLNTGNTLNNVVIRGSPNLTVTTNASYTLNGFFDLRAGPTFTSSSYYAWRVNGPISTAPGSIVTGPYLTMDIGHTTGTANVNGTWSPYDTRFQVAGATVKPSLAYRRMEFFANGSFSGLTTLTENLNASGTGIVLNTNDQTVVVGGNFTLTSGATLQMTGTNDALIVAGNFNSDNGSTNSNVTSGVIRVRGDVNFSRLNPTGTNKLIVDSLASGSPQGFYSTTPFNRVEVRTNRQVRFDNNFTINDTLNILSPTVVGNAAGYVTTLNGPVLSVPASTTVGGYWQMMHATGTSLVNGNWNVTTTRWYGVEQVINPSLAYQNMEFYSSAAFSGPTTMTGYLYASGAGVVVSLGGKKVTVGNYFQLRTGATLSMTAPAEELLVAGSFDSDNGSTNSTVTDGVIRVRGDVYGNRLNPTGASKMVLDSLVSGSSSPPQVFSASLTPWNRVEVRTNRPVNFNTSMTFNDTLNILSTTTVTTIGYTSVFAGPVISVAGSTIQGGVIRLQHPSSADNILGNLGTGGNELQLSFTLPGKVPAAARFSYQHLRIMANAIAQLPVGATAQTGTSGAPGDLILDTNAQFDIPATSTFRICRNIALALTPTPATITNQGVFTIAQSAASYGASIGARIFTSGPGSLAASTPCP